MGTPVSLLLALALSISPTVRVEITSFPCDRDTTLIEESNGYAANGAGPLVFGGRTAQQDNTVRRALIHFDLTPPPAHNPVNAMDAAGVSLVLTNVIDFNVTPVEYRLHRVLADWGEGTSFSPGGIGAPPTPGDATWVHRSYPDEYWLHNGAQFHGEPSARLLIAGAGVYRFEGDGLLDDVRLWLAHPEQNFGWILIGDETRAQTARAFGSRESDTPTSQPALEITTRGRR